MPGRKIGIGGLQHHVPSARIVIPAFARWEVDRAELPLPQAIVDARLESSLLLLIAYLEPVFDQADVAVETRSVSDKRRLSIWRTPSLQSLPPGPTGGIIAPGTSKAVPACSVSHVKNYGERGSCGMQQ